MKRIDVLLFCLLMLGFSFYGLLTNSHYAQVFINISAPFMLARICIALSLLAYVFVPRLRTQTTRILAAISGALLLSLGLASIASPTLLGHLHTQILLGDSVTLFETGIFAIILSLEATTHSSRFIVKAFKYVKLPLGTPLNNAVTTQMVNSLDGETVLSPHMRNDNTGNSAHLSTENSYDVSRRTLIYK